VQADQSHPWALTIKATRLLRAAARATHDRARVTIAEDQARRLRMRDLRRRAEQTSDSARASGSRLMSGHRPAVQRSRLVGGGEAHEPSIVFTTLSGDDPPLPTTQPLQLCSDAPTPTHVVLRVAGEIDIATAPALAEALELRAGAAPPGTDLIADLTAVTFIDARGLATLLEAAATARRCGVAFRVTGRPPCVLRILELTRTRDLMDVR
jgi:anti-sigma B factor antagonist